MEDIPQPSTEAYSVGDIVQIYLGADDPDAQYHDMTCEVVEVHTDELGDETGRSTDAYSYTLRNPKSNNELPIVSPPRFGSDRIDLSKLNSKHFLQWPSGLDRLVPLTLVLTQNCSEPCETGPSTVSNVGRAILSEQHRCPIQRHQQQSTELES